LPLIATDLDESSRMQAATSELFGITSSVKSPVSKGPLNFSKPATPYPRDTSHGYRKTSSAGPLICSPKITGLEVYEDDRVPFLSLNTNKIQDPEMMGKSDTSEKVSDVADAIITNNGPQTSSSITKPSAESILVTDPSIIEANIGGTRHISPVHSPKSNFSDRQIVTEQDHSMETQGSELKGRLSPEQMLRRSYQENLQSGQHREGKASVQDQSSLLTPGPSSLMKGESAEGQYSAINPTMIPTNLEPHGTPVSITDSEAENQLMPIQPSQHGALSQHQHQSEIPSSYKGHGFHRRNNAGDYRARWNLKHYDGHNQAPESSTRHRGPQYRSRYNKLHSSQKDHTSSLQFQDNESHPLSRSRDSSKFHGQPSGHGIDFKQPLQATSELKNIQQPPTDSVVSSEKISSPQNNEAQPVESTDQTTLQLHDSSRDNTEDEQYERCKLYVGGIELDKVNIIALFEVYRPIAITKVRDSSYSRLTHKSYKGWERRNWQFCFAW
jgi:hypothetical protein